MIMGAASLGWAALLCFDIGVIDMKEQARSLIARGARISTEIFGEDFKANGVSYRGRFSGVGENFELADAGIDYLGTAQMRVSHDSPYVPNIRDEIEVRGKKFYISEIFPLPLEGFKCSLEARR